MAFRFPALFVGHGAPTLSIQANATTRFFTDWPRNLSVPRAVIVVSAHWDSGRALRIMSWERAPIIHDFRGFPEELYRLDYPAPGSLEVAAELRDTLSAAGYEEISLDSERGLDHGAWIPLRFMYPAAEIPVLQLSLPVEWTVEELYALGRALAPVREKDVLVMGSGGAVHNLSALDWQGNGKVADWALVFERWLRENLADWNTEDLLDYWRMAPHGVQAHPTDEHLKPLFVAMGAGDGDRKAKIVHDGFMFGSLSMLAVEFS